MNVVMPATREQAADVAERRFFTTMALAARATVFVGFATSYYLWPITRALVDAAGQRPPLPSIVHVHAIGFTTWVLLFVAQVRLIAQGGGTATGGSAWRERGWSTFSSSPDS